MLNDRSSALALLETRRSEKPRQLVGPAPSAAELERMLKIATRVPDHGKLTPWRLVIIEDDQRDAFAAVLRQALSQEDPCATIAHHNKEDEFAHYAGALVVLVSRPAENHKIPVWEQELSCGAVGMNLLNAATAMGYVAGWVTGWRAYSPGVTAALCEPGERIGGFIFIGHPGAIMEDRARPDVEQIARSWKPEQL